MPIAGNNIHGGNALLEARIDSALSSVKAELYRAMTKHRSMASAHEGHSVIREEFNQELWEHVCRDTAATVEGRAEAIQVAAMAVRFALDVCGDNPPTLSVHQARTHVPSPS